MVDWRRYHFSRFKETRSLKHERERLERLGKTERLSLRGARMARWLCCSMSEDGALTEPLIESFASLDRESHDWQL
jgi:hypothetical protein